MIEIYDDVVTQKLADKIEQQSESIANIWNYDATTVEQRFKISDNNTVESFQFRSLMTF